LETDGEGPAKEVLEQRPGAADGVAEELQTRELAVADRALRAGSPAGKATDTVPGARYQWHPLRGPIASLGVVGLANPVALGARRREDLLEAILNQVAAALERRRLSEAARQAELLQASERLHSVLLNSVSHDLRIPLVSIQGALTTLLDKPTLLDDDRRKAVIGNALSETDRLNRLVGNLLQKTRLETGHLTLRLLPCDVDDLLSTTVASMSHRLEGRPCEIAVEADLPLVAMDFVLMAQVVTNLLENALAYSNPGTPITLRASRQDGHLRLEVLDRGVGLGSLDPEQLFEKFARGGSPNASGVGLGLSICRGLVEAHHGKVWGANREGGGAVFSLTLPLEERYVHGDSLPAYSGG
jgi:two-component system sensor histidine kinase KdpD